MSDVIGRVNDNKLYGERGVRMLCELYALKPFALGSFLTWFFMWKYRGYRKIKTFEIKEL